MTVTICFLIFLLLLLPSFSLVTRAAFGFLHLFTSGKSKSHLSHTYTLKHNLKTPPCEFAGVRERSGGKGEWGRRSGGFRGKPEAEVGFRHLWSRYEKWPQLVWLAVKMVPGHSAEMGYTVSVSHRWMGNTLTLTPNDNSFKQTHTQHLIHRLSSCCYPVA